MIEHHPIFSKFQPYCGNVEDGFNVDFIGAKSRCEFIAGATSQAAAEVRTQYPPIDDEYFEWVDVLQSVVSAKGIYTMIELGAGYGRWAVRASCALRQYRGGRFHLIAVEPEPTHFRWLQRHFLDNGIEPSEHTLVQGVVCDKKGLIRLYVGMPWEGKDQPDEWYGQEIAGQYEATSKKYRQAYGGFDLLEHPSGWKSIEVQSVELGGLIENIETVHLIDLDVQGQELNVIASAIEEINRKVVRLHIGTHSQEIEVGLRDLLARNGWQSNADYACGSTNETPWGPVNFGDGVQSWLNPGLA